MAGTLRIAWRNLGRNLRRSVITGAALALGTSLSVAGFGLTDGMKAELLTTLTRFDLGHAQIHQRDFPRTRAIGDTIDDPAAVLATARAEPGVVAATPRVYAYALASHDDRSLGCELVGVAPRSEPLVTQLDRQRVAGSYLPGEPTPWARGRALTTGERALDRELTDKAERDATSEIEALQPLDHASPAPHGATPSPDDGTRALALVEAPPPAHPLPAFVGSALARILHAGVGDELHATGQAIDGTSEDVPLRIAGVFTTGTTQLDRRIYLDIADLQRFTHLGARIHEIAMSSSSPDRAAVIAADLGPRIGPSLVVRDWAQIRPDIAQMVRLEEITTAVMIFIILFVATLGVVNTMLMAVFERTRELGVLKAIGMSGARIVGMIVAETTLLVLAAATIGTALGFAMDAYMLHVGIDLSALTSGISFGGLGVTPVIHAAITLHGLVIPATILAATCFVASFYPAVRAARLRPAIGMRHT